MVFFSDVKVSVTNFGKLWPNIYLEIGIFRKVFLGNFTQNTILQITIVENSANSVHLNVPQFPSAIVLYVCPFLDAQVKHYFKKKKKIGENSQQKLQFLKLISYLRGIR